MAVSDSVRERWDGGLTAEQLGEYPGRDRPMLLAIVLSRDERATQTEVEVAIRGGAHGVFLVADGIGHQELLSIARTVLRRHPKLFVGVRCLDLRPQDVFCRLPAGVRGVWTDAPPAGTNGDGLREAHAAVAHARRESGWSGLHFMTWALPAAGGAGSPGHGGDPAMDAGASAPGLEATALSARAPCSAADAADVIVLAGPTGLQPPPVGLVQQASSMAGDRPVAIVGEQPGPRGPQRVLHMTWPALGSGSAPSPGQIVKQTEKLVS